MPKKIKVDVTIDTRGMYGNIPISKAHKSLKEMEMGQVVEVLTNEEGIDEEFKIWCEKAGHELLKIDKDEQGLRIFIRKGK